MDATNGNHLQTTSNDADYNQLLGQAEHRSIPLQFSILCNPWFLIEVAARLQRNEVEVSSEDASAALDHKMDRFKERSTFELCINIDQVNDKLKPDKTKFASRVTRKPDAV
jgi:hypothetical protein